MTLENSDRFQELKKWFFKYRLRNGVEGCYPISGSDKERLWNGLQKTCKEKGVNFFEFDSKTHRILMQASQLIFFQFLFEPICGITHEDCNDDEDNDSYPVKFYFTNSPRPIILQVEEDEPDPEDEGNEGEMSNFLFSALHLCKKGELLHVTDEDGETAFFRGSSIALVEIPLEVFQFENACTHKDNTRVSK